MLAEVLLICLVNVAPWTPVFSKRLRRYMAKSLWWAPIRSEQDLEGNETLVMTLGSLMGLMVNALFLCLVVASFFHG